MLRSFFTKHTAIEIDKELKHLKYGIQLLTDETDLIYLSKNLLETARKQVQIEIIIISQSNKKSMKITNLMKRLIDSGVEIYWYNISVLEASLNLFSILDKSYLISADMDSKEDSKEVLIRSKVDDFNQILRLADPIKLYAGDIEVTYSVDKSIIAKGEEVLLNWDVKNAHTVIIMPELDEVAHKGTQLVAVNKSTKYQLIAKNSNAEVQRTIFLKVMHASSINFTIEVFDPVIEEYIRLESLSEDILKFGVYLNQQVRIIWETESIGKLVEQSLGTLPLNSFHDFIPVRDTHFSFEFTSQNIKTGASIQFFTFEPVELVDKRNDPQQTTDRVNKIKKAFQSFYQKIAKSI
jgi:hypothetical protein